MAGKRRRHNLSSMSGSATQINQPSHSISMRIDCPKRHGVDSMVGGAGGALNVEDRSAVCSSLDGLLG